MTDGTAVMRTTVKVVVIGTALGLIGCGGNPEAPSPVQRVYADAISGQLSLPTTNQVPTMCVGGVFPANALRPNLTCIVTQSCASTSNLQLAVKTTIDQSRNGSVTGTAEITGTETIHICGPGPTVTVPLALTYPATGSVSNVAFTGTTSSMEPLFGRDGPLVAVKRTVAFMAPLRNGVIAGVLTYSEEFTSGFATNGSGSGTFALTLR